MSADQRAHLVDVLAEHRTVATGPGDWCCRCSPTTWRPSAWWAGHIADALLEAGVGFDPRGRDVPDEAWDEYAERARARCGCYACIGNKPSGTHPWLTFGMTQMIVCAECGNKRCPHGTDHRNPCTGSNAPGQPGSRYGEG